MSKIRTRTGIKLSDLELIEVRWRLNRLPIKEMERIATDWLCDGIESKAVLDIASGLVEGLAVYFVFGQALNEMLGRDPISEEDAAYAYAKDMAAKILSGEIDPENGAKKIESLVNTPDGYTSHPDWILGIYNLVDDWDIFWNRPDEYRNQIMQEARKLLDS